MARSIRRRSSTIGGGAAAIDSVAGCRSTGSESPESTLSAQVSFFILGEVADVIAGDVAAAETLVPIGHHGHGWDPDPDTQDRVLDAALFICRAEGFQPWADDLIDSLRDDSAGVKLIATGNAVEILPLTAIPGQTEERVDENGRDIDGMENVTVDTLKTALNA